MTADINSSWRQFRFVRNLFVALLAAPIAIAAVVELAPLSDVVRMALVIGAVALWLPSIVVLVLVLRTWPCPRCGGAFRDSTARTLAGAVPAKTSVCSRCGLRFMEDSPNTELD